MLKELLILITKVLGYKLDQTVLQCAEYYFSGWY